jgi:hypothetical protein
MGRRAGPLQNHVCVGHAADLPAGRNSDIAELSGGRLGCGLRGSLAVHRGRADDLRERQGEDRRGLLRRLRAGSEQTAARQNDSDMEDIEPAGSAAMHARPLVLSLILSSIFLLYRRKWP